MPLRVITVKTTVFGKEVTYFQAASWKN